MEELLNDFKGKLENELELDLSEGIKFDGILKSLRMGSWTCPSYVKILKSIFK